MRKSTKSERFKYVRYDPDGTLGRNDRTKKSLEARALKPWVARPFFKNGAKGASEMAKATVRFSTEREAALFVDKWFLSHGLEPVNILVRKP